MAAVWHEVPPRVWKRVAVVAVLGVLVTALLVAAAAWWWLRGSDTWGDESGVVTSADGRYEAVTYEFRAAIDRGWVVAIRRADDSGRQWFWKSVEHVAPTGVAFDGTTIVVTGSDGHSYRTEFDPDSLEPVDRYCLSLGYCYEKPWTSYTRTGARPGD